MTTVLDHACQANATHCAAYLAATARRLAAPGACAADRAAGNPVAVEAYLGLVAYPVVYAATCLRDPATAVYCLAAAVTDTTDPAGAYVYHLPLNTSLPGGTAPACAACLRRTMAAYQVAAADRQQPIARTYGAAAAQVDALCGPGFANETLPAAIVVASGGAAAARGGTAWVMLAAWALAVAVGCVL